MGSKTKGMYNNYSYSGIFSSRFSRAHNHISNIIFVPTRESSPYKISVQRSQSTNL